MQKCEKCREREATVSIRRVVDKRSTQAQLCEECAREEAISMAWLSGAPIPPEAGEMPLEELLIELLTGAPDPDSFAPEDEKWSLQKLAAYDRLHSRGEFSGDEDLDDEADEMDDESVHQGDAEGIEGEPSELSREELEAALDEMEPGEREAVSQMLEALDEVQDQLESIMLQHAQELDVAGEDAADDSESDGLATLKSLFASELMLPIERDEDSLEDIEDDPFADDEDDDDGVEDGFDPFADGAHDSDPFADDAAPDSQNAESEPLLPGFLMPGMLGLGGFTAPSQQFEEPDASRFKSAPSGRCPKCRTTWDRLREDGRAGCASCYEMFEEELGETMEMGQHAAQHTGKAPRAATRRQRRLEMLRARRDSRLAMLRERLQAALEGEQFEEAAKLRDKIKVVESTIVEPDGRL